MSQLSYIKNGDYRIPNLSLSRQENQPLGKYGRMRKKYLQEHRPVLWNSMLLSETLYPHLQEIDQTANNRLEQMKAANPVMWAGMMNNLKSQAEEVILRELIFS